MSVTFGEHTATDRKGGSALLVFLLSFCPGCSLLLGDHSQGADAKQATSLSTVTLILPCEHLSRGQASPSSLGADGHKSKEK